ncbi:MAG: prepilin peptidase [Gammaproteobacteria bacterium]|nr:prepilin peptidase [Gammaproteobacteria bacterium]
MLLATSPAPWLALAGILGLLVGSFLNVVILRLPPLLERRWQRECATILGSSVPAAAEEPPGLVRPRSRCPACRAPIRAWHNIPVLSWLLLRGRCATCRAPISPRYPLVEAGTGLLSALVAWRFGFVPEAGLVLVLTWVLIALAGIDLEHQLLPDVLTLPLLWLALLASLFHDGAGGLPVSPRDAILGAACGYGFLWLVFQLFRLLTGKEGMGFGDLKLFAAAGAWLGWQMLPLVLLLAAVAGAVTGLALIVTQRHGRGVPIPFGPFLAGAIWIAALWGPAIVERYLSLAGLR